MTELVKWSSTFSVGIKLIDDQHKGLLDLVNEMYNHISGNEAAEQRYFETVIQEAIKYVKIHFATEEKIMLATKFQGYAEHKRAHDAFSLTVVNTIRDYEAGKKTALAAFTKFLKEWILTHIAIMDKQYFNYFRKIASRKEDGSLTIAAADIGNK